jgi:hypothetical protein
MHSRHVQFVATAGLLCKLGSLVVHVDEALSKALGLSGSVGSPMNFSFRKVCGRAHGNPRPLHLSVACVA